MEFNQEELGAEFSSFLQDALEKTPDIKMEDFIQQYFDTLVCTSFFPQN